MKTTRPRQYWDDYASRFKNRSLAETYELRPPYPDETYEVLLSLLGDKRRRVLDVGCGPGKIARTLVDHVDGVDAVDFSQEMIRVGQSLINGDHPNLQWIDGPVEEAQLYPPYAMITAGASIHWMEWSVVFPRFKEVLTTEGYLVIIDGDRPVGSPWQDAELSLIRKYSTNRHHEPIDLIQELVSRGHLDVFGDKLTTPVRFLAVAYGLCPVFSFQGKHVQGTYGRGKRRGHLTPNYRKSYLNSLMMKGSSVSN